MVRNEICLWGWEVLQSETALAGPAAAFCPAQLPGGGSVVLMHDLQPVAPGLWQRPHTHSGWEEPSGRQHFPSNAICRHPILPWKQA